MSAREHFLGLVDASGEIRRPALVGVQPLHQPAMSLSDIVNTRTRLQAKDLVSFLFGHFAARRSVPPRCRVSIRVLTPAGIPAVKIRN
jgi:hypothetical protein